MPLTINVQPGPEELERTREVLHVLAKGGVAVANLEAKLAREDDNMRTREVLELAEEFGKVCAYVNHEAMFAGLGTAWTCHQGRLLAVKKDMYRKLRVLEADQKADFNVVENLRRNRDLVERQIAEVNQRLTKLRLIKQQYDEERVAALQQAQDEEQRKMFQEMGLSM